MEKLQTILEWLAKADQYEIESLANFLETKDFFYLEGVISTRDYEAKIEEISQQAIEDYKESIGE